MRPIHIKLSNEMKVIVIPDSDAHADGHAVLTYRYSIYRNNFTEDSRHIKALEDQLHLEKKSSPFYMGTITFEQPGKLFTYDPGEEDNLQESEVEELIEMISHYRDTPSMWAI